MDPFEYLIPGNSIYVRYDDTTYKHGIIKYVNHVTTIGKTDAYANCTILYKNDELINHNLYKSDYENEEGILTWKYDTVTSMALKRAPMEYELDEIDEDMEDADEDAEDADEDEDEDADAEEEEEDEDAEEEEEDEDAEDAEDADCCDEGHHGCIIIRERETNPLIIFSTLAMHFSVAAFFSLCVYRLAVDADLI